MATFKVIQRTYRDSKMYEPGETFTCADEATDQHCDSVALVAADSETEETILVYADESKAAAKIIETRERSKKSAEKKQKLADIKKAKEQESAKS